MYCLGKLARSASKKLRKQEIISAEEGLGGPRRPGCSGCAAGKGPARFRRGRLGRYSGIPPPRSRGDLPPLRNSINDKLLRRRPCSQCLSVAAEGEVPHRSRENCAGASGGHPPGAGGRGRAPSRAALLHAKLPLCSTAEHPPLPSAPCQDSNLEAHFWCSAGRA